MTTSLPWPRLGDPREWTHATVSIERGLSGKETRVVDFEIWARYPAVVVREIMGGQTMREVRANAGNTASLDVEGSQCLAQTGLDAQSEYEAAIARTAGPVAELYGERRGKKSLPEGWRRLRSRNAARYHNRGPGSLREATIDPQTGLPLEAITVDGRLRWEIRVVGNDAPPAAPDVRTWTKESHERTMVPMGARPIEHIRFRTSSLPRPLEFIVRGRTRVVIGHEPSGDETRVARMLLDHPEGRPVTLLAGKRAFAQTLVAQVADRLAAERLAPDAEEETDQWNGRINELVGSITDVSADQAT